MLASELGEASFAVALVGSPVASRVASQAPAWNAGVLDIDLPKFPKGNVLLSSCFYYVFPGKACANLSM